MDLPISGGWDAVLNDRLAANDAGYFSATYLNFLFSIDEMGAAFQVPGQTDILGPINVDMLKKVSEFITKLPLEVKMIMCQQLDGFMVNYTIDDREPQVLIYRLQFRDSWRLILTKA